MVTQYIAKTYTASPTVLAAIEQQDVEKLEMVIRQAISSIGSSCGLSESEVMDVLGNVRVSMSSELKSAVESLQKQGIIKPVDSSILSRALEQGYRMVAQATDLNTDELTDMFTRLKGANMDKIVARIHTKSRLDRFDQS